MKKGFTLIELSIVLVIIGLIVGGVLVGRELIHAAEVRSVVKDFENYKTAFNTFRLKYNCLPADCPNGTSFFGSNVYNGDGDGFICPIAMGTDIFNQCTFQFWQYLSQANLYSGPSAMSGTNYRPLIGTDIPIVKGAGTNVGMGAAAGKPVSTNPVSGNFIWAGSLTDAVTGGNFGAGNAGKMYGAAVNSADAYSIDSKLDDGQQYKGRMMSGEGGNDWTNSAPYAGCNYGAPTEQRLACKLYYKLD